MRSLMINKFLYPNGGSETYIFKLGEALEQHGHRGSVLRYGARRPLRGQPGQCLYI